VNPLTTSKDQLDEAGQRLSAAWSITQELWNDAARREFENNFWMEFETTTAASIRKLQELIDTITQAEREIP
jgi:uncharacterized protein YukE